MTLGDRFDPRANGLNAVRLFLATLVILWHAVPLSGRVIGWEPGSQLAHNLPVDGFFAVSGFLITASWLRRPALAPYLRARLLRIMPAFWVCLVVTAFVIAPVGARVLGQEVTLVGEARYVLGNSALWITEYGVDGTPTGVPVQGVWNGSLWTLVWEALCYLAVAGLGVVGLLRWPRATFVAVAGAGWVGSVVVLAGFTGLNLEHVARFTLMFGVGALLWLLRDHIPLHPWALVAAGGLIVAAAFLPDYRLLAAPAVAYLAVGAGALLSHPRWRMRNDLSYGTYVYAFPMQQLLVCLGAATLPLAVFMGASILATIPLAAGSWFLVERPVLRLKRSRTRESAPATPESATGARV